MRKLSYKRQIELIAMYLYNQSVFVENELQERIDYFKYHKVYKDEVDYLEDMILQIRLKEINRINRDIFNLIHLEYPNTKGEEKH